MELYRVTSAINKLPHDGLRYNGVQVNWFMANRRMPVVQYKVAIKDYGSLSEKDALRPRELVKELFTSGEAQALKQYLEMTRKQKVEIIPFALPVEAVNLGFKGHPVGSSSGFYQLCDERGYSLSFKVWGFYSVEGLKPAFCVKNIVASVRHSLMQAVQSVVSHVKRPSVKKVVA